MTFFTAKKDIRNDVLHQMLIPVGNAILGVVNRPPFETALIGFFGLLDPFEPNLAPEGIYISWTKKSALAVAGLAGCSFKKNAWGFEVTHCP